MYVVQVQIKPDTRFSAADVERAIRWAAEYDWTDTAPDRFKRATDAAKDVIPKGAIIVNYATLEEAVEGKQPSDSDLPGFFVNVEAQAPAVFYYAKGFVRIPHINYAFDPTAEFQFDTEMLLIHGLDETEKLMLRLANNIGTHKMADQTERQYFKRD